VLHLVEAKTVVWMPDRCLTMMPGDLAFLPRGERTWRAYGKQAVRLSVTVNPCGFEDFFATIQAHSLHSHDVRELTQVWDEFGITVSVPPPSDEEVARVIAQ
jgi:hypothetical protein